MKLPRRQFLGLAAGTAAVPVAAGFAWAQTYPSRPVRIIVGTVPGDGLDSVARLMGQWLSERLGQPFIVENRPGAGTNIGAEAVVRAPADGYTLLLATGANAINATLYAKLNFNFVRDITPVSGIMRFAQVMTVNPSFPAKTVPEFITYAKANPGKVAMASPGIGTGNHLAGEMFKMMADIDMLHVPYRGAAPAITDLLGGQVQVMFNTTPASIAFIRGGKLRALAVTTATRVQELPDIPSMREFLPAYEFSGWFGVGAPNNTPAEIVDELNKEINAALADPGMKARFADLGGVPMLMSPADFGKFIAGETEKWRKVIRAANIKPE